jgi:serine/threonine protein kinase
MAYEQFVDARSVDGRADLYSVAAMLYELLARRLPYQANSYGELIVKIENETPTPLKEMVPQLPVRLCDIVDKGLKRNRDERFQTAREFLEALSMVGPIREVEIKTVLAMSALPPEDEERNNETRVRAPTTEPSAASSGGSKVNRAWQVAPTVIAAAAAEKVPDSTVLMAPPEFKETRDSVREAAPDLTPVAGSSSVRARRDEARTDPVRQALSTAILPGPRPSRPISQESREQAMGVQKPPGLPRWVYVLGGVTLLAGALALYLVLR